MSLTSDVQVPARSIYAVAVGGAKARSASSPTVAASSKPSFSCVPSGRSVGHSLRDVPVVRPVVVAESVSSGKDPDSDDVDLSFSYDADQLEAILQQLDD
jgi:hypothetical protein